MYIIPIIAAFLTRIKYVSHHEPSRPNVKSNSNHAVGTKSHKTTPCLWGITTSAHLTHHSSTPHHWLSKTAACLLHIFSHSNANYSPIGYNPPNPPTKLPLPMRRSPPYLHWISLGPPDPPPQTASISSPQFTGQFDRQTDYTDKKRRPTRKITSNNNRFV